MNSLFLRPCFVAFVSFVLLSTASADVRKVALARTPPEVRSTITRTAGVAKINHVSRRAENGEITFEVSIQRNGVEREFTVSNDGELLNVEVGIEEIQPLARATIQRVVGTNEIERIDKAVENDPPDFEVSFEKAGQSREFTVSAEGVMTRYELNYLELPALVRKTVQAQIATNQIERVDRTFEDGELNYDVQFKDNGETRVLTVGTNGVLSRLEIGLNQTSDAVRKTIQAQLHGWKLGDIDKVFDEGDVTYEVEAKKGRLTREFTIDEAGKLLSETIELADVPETARKAIQNKVGAGKITRLERNYEDDNSLTFDIESMKNGKHFDFSIGADGKLLEEN